MDDFNGYLARAAAIRKELIASLPCATCEIDTEAAHSCKVYDQSGCKHVEQLGIRRAAAERIRNRISNLSRAGLDASMLADDDELGDEKLQLVLRDTIEPWIAVRAVRKALTSKALRFLVLGGDHRTGKTLALIYACASSPDAVYIPAQKLGRINQDTSRWIDAKVLCVNELGREHLGNGYTASNLEELMAEREYGRKLTIFATNRPMKKVQQADLNEPPALVDRYGDLFASRIKPPVGAYVICRAGPVELESEPQAPVNNPVPFNERAES